MKRRVVKREAALRDLRDYAAFLAEESPYSAIRFLKAAEQTFKQLSKMPDMGASYDAIVPALKKIRRFRAKGFDKCLIFYVPIDNGIEVVRVIHGSRDIEAIFES